MSFKSGYVAILGKPNVGKSTLLNVLVGEKLSIVNPKPGTTRDKIFGILTRPDGQIIFIDTPGWHRPKATLGRLMVQEAESSLEESDINLLMIDAKTGFTEEDSLFVELIKERNRTVFLLINKVDIVNKGRILPLIEEASRMKLFKEIIPISSVTGENIKELLKLVFENLPEGGPYYPEGEISNRPERFFVSEMIREKALELLREEVPHAVAVEIEEMAMREEKNLWFIRALIYVEKDSQKSILIGKSGQMLKKIGEESRKEIENFLSKKVFLALWVKVLKDWRKDEKALKKLGFIK